MFNTSTVIRYITTEELVVIVELDCSSDEEGETVLTAKQVNFLKEVEDKAKEMDLKYLGLIGKVYTRYHP